VMVRYDQLQEQYRPDQFEVLLVGSSYPTRVLATVGCTTPALQTDNLCRGAAQGLHGDLRTGPSRRAHHAATAPG
jgi:hypothetical protein